MLGCASPCEADPEAIKKGLKSGEKSGVSAARSVDDPHRWRELAAHVPTTYIRSARDRRSAMTIAEGRFEQTEGIVTLTLYKSADYDHGHYRALRCKDDQEIQRQDSTPAGASL